MENWKLKGENWEKSWNENRPQLGDKIWEKRMNTYIAYFDETGDDGFNTSLCEHFILKLMDYLKSKDKFNLKASKNDYGLVIYPK